MMQEICRSIPDPAISSLVSQLLSVDPRNRPEPAQAAEYLRNYHWQQQHQMQASAPRQNSSPLHGPQPRRENNPNFVTAEIQNRQNQHMIQPPGQNFLSAAAPQNRTHEKQPVARPSSPNTNPHRMR